MGVIFNSLNMYSKSVFDSISKIIAKGKRNKLKILIIEKDILLTAVNGAGDKLRATHNGRYKFENCRERRI